MRTYHRWRQVASVAVGMLVAGVVAWFFGWPALVVTAPLCLAWGMVSARWVWTRE